MRRYKAKDDDLQLNLFDKELPADKVTKVPTGTTGHATVITTKLSETSLSHIPHPSASPLAPAPTLQELLAKYDHRTLFAHLSQSTFRSRFHLSAKDIAYIRNKGMDTIQRHATEMVARRLAPAMIPNDGKQTPMRGHPVFVAQHATACCCRGCFAKWHHIAPGHTLTTDEQQYAVSVLMTWITNEYNRANP